MDKFFQFMQAIRIEDIFFADSDFDCCGSFELGKFVDVLVECNPLLTDMTLFTKPVGNIRSLGNIFNCKS